MRWRVPAILAAAWLLAAPFPRVQAEDNTLQYQYLKIYLKINDADQLEKQGNYQAALTAFKDCYTKLQKIHTSDPNWESALVIQRMNDCRSKIVELSNRPMEPAPAPDTNAPAGPDTNGTSASTPAVSAPASPEVAALKKRLIEVEQELNDTKAKLQNSQIEATALRSQLAAVNDQLAALKGQQSEDNQVGHLLNQNKLLTDKLAAAQKEIASIKSPNPKSALSLLRTQLKNTQDKLDASEAANTALQQTTTTLRQQLDDAQADLKAANQRLAASPTTSPEYETLKRENEVMREILTRELQEQAHRDMAKRLAQEEFDRLRITSKVLQEQLDILGSPMTPPTSDQERALLDSLRVASAQVAPVPPAGNGFAASNTNSTSSPAAPTTNMTAAPSSPETTNAPAASAPETNAPSAETASTNAPSATPPLTNSALADANQSVPAVTPPSPTTVTPAAPPTTNAAPATTENAPTNSAAASASTNAPPATTSSTNAPAATTNPETASATNAPAATPPSTNVASTNAAPAAPTETASEYSSKPRLPADMRDTAQQAADLFKMQRYDDAAAKYQEIIEKYPESLYAWSNLGVVRFQQGKLAEALKALQQAVKLSPTDAFSYSNLGIVYYQMGQYDSAISALERALALDPTNAKSHNYLGCACSQKGWSEVAEKEFLKAIEIDDTFGDAHFNLALVYATEKPPSLEMARRHYRRALELGISPDPRLEKLLQLDGAQNPPATAQK